MLPLSLPKKKEKKERFIQYLQIHCTKKKKIFHSDIQYLQIHRAEKETILNIQLALLIDGLVFLKRIYGRWGIYHSS
jgi:hypothetical protein